MKLRWLNFVPFFLSTLFLFSTLFIISCDSGDGNEKITCRPSAVKISYTAKEDTNGDGFYKEEVTHTFIYEYVYNAENKIETMLIHENDRLAKMTLEYNDKALLAKVVHFYLDRPEEISTWQLTYDDQSKPQEIRQWIFEDDLSKPPFSVETFTHDGVGRLITRAGSDVWLPTRFEYNNDDNVTKIFLEFDDSQLLFLENLLFDPTSKHYSSAPELEILYVYVFRFQPGRNNPLTARVHSYTNSKPESTEVTYDMTYDENGRITSRHASTLVDDFLGYSGDFDFDEVTYSCK